ncbi:MAG: HIT domain-containing protein [Defluviitaleaceae bacterium]|nr:HIT domain-containing protein [Defluviitaleaceae bacterium]
MSFSDNLFYKIIQNEEHSYKVYEDDDFVVILDKFPAEMGHCLIMPKVPAVDVFDLDEGSAAGLYPLAKKVAAAVRSATGCDGVKILQNNGACSGQVIFYFHLHVIPCYSGGKKLSKSPLSNEFEEMAAKLAANLR